MKGVPPGSVLIGVDGELLNVDNFSKIFAKVTAWTDVPEQQQQQQSSAASINDKEENGDDEEEDDDAQHPSPESEREERVVKDVNNDNDSSFSDEEKQAQDNSNGPVDVSSTVPTISQESEIEDDAPEETTPTTQTSGQAVAAEVETPTRRKKKKKKRGKGSGGGGRDGLRLTFRLQAKQAPLVEVQEIFPLGLGDGFHISNKAQQEAEEEIEAHVVFINDLKEQVGDPNLPDRLAEHFLVMYDMDVIKAKVQVSGSFHKHHSTVKLRSRKVAYGYCCPDDAFIDTNEQYEAAREEARELMNEIDSEVDLADDCPGEQVNLVWDPAEEGPNVEEFPLFEAETLSDSSSPSGDDIATTPR